MSPEAIIERREEMIRSDRQRVRRRWYRYAAAIFASIASLVLVIEMEQHLDVKAVGAGLLSALWIAIWRHCDVENRVADLEDKVRNLEQDDSR